MSLAPAELESLKQGVAELGKAIAALREAIKEKPDLLAFLPDVQIYFNAVQYPLDNHEPIDVGMARRA